MTNLTSITKWWEKFLGSFPSHCEQLDDTSETDPDTHNTSVVSQESTIIETERERASMLKYFDLFLWSAGGGDKTLIWGDLLSSNGLGLVCARQDQWAALSHHCSLRTLLESDWCVPRVSRYEHYDDDLIQAHIGSNLLLCLTATEWCEVGSGCIMKISHISNTETGWLMCCKIVNIMHCVNTDDCSKSNCATIIFLSLDIILRRHS